MTDLTASVFEDSCSISEFDSDELHRIHSSKNIRTLESLKRTNLKQEELSVDKIREFLHDTCTSAAFDTLKNEEPLDAQKFEKIIYKQQFLEKMNLFNPTKYFSGIESTTFEDILLDRRLGEMFMEELPLEDDNDKENNLNSANGVRAESNKPNGKTKHKKTNSNLSKQQSMNQKAFKNFYQDHENPSKKHSGEHTSKMNWDAFHSKSNKNTPVLNLGSKLNSGSKMNSGVKSKKIKTPMTQSFTQNEAGHFISNLPAGSPIRAKGLDLNDFHSKSKLTLNNGRESTKESSVKKSDTPTQTRRTRIGSPVVMNLQQNTQKETTATKFNHKKSPLNYNIQPHFDHQYKKASSFVENSCGEGASNRAGSNQTRTAHPSFIENLRNQSSEKSGDKVRKKLFSTKSNLNKETLSIKQTPAPAQKLNTCFDLADKPKTTTPSLYHLKMPKMQHYPGKKLKNNSGPGQRFATEL